MGRRFLASRGWTRGPVLAALALFAAFAFLGVLLNDSHNRSRDAARARFEERAAISAALTNPLFEYAIGFGPRGARRQMVEGIRLRFMSRFLHDYLGRLPNPDRAVLTLVDGGGRQIASDTRHTAAGGGDLVKVDEAVPGTPWR